MNKKSSMRRSLFVFAAVGVMLSLFAIAPFIFRSAASTLIRPMLSLRIHQPREATVVDDYFGTKVPDPYRWLENENSAETKAWVDAENVLTFGYLDKIPYREKLKARSQSCSTIQRSLLRFDAVTLTSSPRMMDCKTKTCTTSKKV